MSLHPGLLPVLPRGDLRNKINMIILTVVVEMFIMALINLLLVMTMLKANFTDH